MLHERLVSVALSKAVVLREWHFAAILTFYAFIQMGLSLSPNVWFAPRYLEIRERGDTLEEKF